MKYGVKEISNGSSLTFEEANTFYSLEGTIHATIHAAIHATKPSEIHAHEQLEIHAKDQNENDHRRPFTWSNSVSSFDNVISFHHDHTKIGPGFVFPFQTILY